MWQAASTSERTRRCVFAWLHTEHAGARLAGSNGPMKPPRSGRAQCAPVTRRRVRPLPSVGGAAPHMQHGSIISRVAAASLA